MKSIKGPGSRESFPDPFCCQKAPWDPHLPAPPRPGEPPQGVPDVPGDADRAVPDLPGHIGLLLVDAGIDGPGTLPRHPPEGILDDAGGVHAHPQLQIQHGQARVAAQKRLIPLRRGVPPAVLDEGVVSPQIHGHGSAAPRAAGDQLRGDPHVPLLLRHPPDGPLVVVGRLMAGRGALPEAVVPLGIEQPLLVKARQLELVVHIGGEDKVVPLPHQRQQIVIYGPGRPLIAVVEDLAAPPGPVLLQAVKGVEAPGVHVPDAVFGLKIAEIPLKPLPVVGQPRRGGQPGPRAHDHGIGDLQRLSQRLDPVFSAHGGRRYPAPRKHQDPPFLHRAAAAAR